MHVKKIFSCVRVTQPHQRFGIAPGEEFELKVQDPYMAALRKQPTVGVGDWS